MIDWSKTREEKRGLTEKTEAENVWKRGLSSNKWTAMTA